MYGTINFAITDNGPVSKAFLEKGCSDFSAAAQLIKGLTYKRNVDKKNLLTVFTENSGTCSTKHASLRLLAIENNRPDIKLMLGVVKMDAVNAPKIAATLKKHGLEYMPEAHNYLMVGDQRLDYTFPNSNGRDLTNELMAEIEIEPQQITTFKVNYHKKVLAQWIADTRQTKTLEEIWVIREQCIADLAS